MQAAQQRLAEQYTISISNMAKDSNVIIVPDKPSDVSSVMASAFAVGSNLYSSMNSIPPLPVVGPKTTVQAPGAIKADPKVAVNTKSKGGAKEANPPRARSPSSE